MAQIAKCIANGIAKPIAKSISGTEVNVFSTFRLRVTADGGTTLLGADGTYKYLDDQIRVLKNLTASWSEYINKVQADSGTLLLGSNNTLSYLFNQVNLLQV